MASKEHHTYAFAQRPISERDLAGIIKYHPEEKEPIMKVLIHWSRKLIQTYLDWDEDITDDHYLLFKERLEQGYIKYQEKIEEEKKLQRKCSKCASAIEGIFELCLSCGKYECKDGSAPEKELFYKRGFAALFDADCDADYDAVIKAFSAFLTLAEAEAEVHYPKLKIVKPDGDNNLESPDDDSQENCYDQPIIIAYQLRGQAYRKKGQYDKAVSDFSRALVLDRKNTELLEKRAEAHKANGDHDNAVADLQYALELAEKYMANGLYKTDVEREKNGEIFELPPEPPHYSLLLAQLYKDMGDVDKAFDVLNASLEDWNSEGVLASCAELYETTGDYQTAYEYWQKVHKIWQGGEKERQDTLAENKDIADLFDGPDKVHEEYITVNLLRCKKKAEAAGSSGGGNILPFNKNWSSSA